MEVTKVNYKNGDFVITMDHLGKIMLLADSGYDIMKDCGNFIELHMKHNTGEEFVFTMQKKKTVTPSEYRAELEKEIIKLKKQLIKRSE